MATSAINIKANAQEVINLKRKIDELSSALVSMQRSANPALYDKLNSQLQKTTIQYNALRSEVNRYSKEQERAAKATTQTSDGLVDLLKKGAALAGITYGVDKIKQLGSEIISVRGEIQQLQIAFETMLGSKEKADRMMADIKKLALSTPFTLTEVADNTKQIIAMGIASDKAIDTVKILGDVAAGVSVPLWRVAINYGQVSALGKLQSREIRDFAMAGIPIVEELGKMLGKTSAEIYDMVEAGKIGFPQVEQAFKNMSGEGGKFYNLMEKQNASVTGQISKLKDSIQLMFNEIGESSEGIIYTAIDGASKLVDSYQEVGVILAGLVSTYGLYKAALMTEAAIRPIQIADTYKVQAAALTELLNGEQAYRISQIGLVQGSAEHVAAIQAEIAATAENLKIKLAEEEVNLQSLRTKRAEAEQVWMTAKAKTEAARQELASAITNATGEAEASLQKKMALESEKQSRAALRLVKLQDQKDTAISQAIALKEKEASAEKIAAKNREIASIQAKIASARAEEIQHGRNVAAMRAEIKSGVDITANKNVQTLTNKLNTLSEQENSAATAHSGVVKQIVGSKVLIKKLSVDADTAATILNTEAEIANTTATTFLSAAKTKLITISKNLWAALAPNPYALAAAAVVALVYGIYKLATYQTEAEKTQLRLNETTKKYESAIEGEKVKLDILFGRLKSAKEGTDKYKEAKQGILNIADQYHLSIGKDIDLVKEETKYRKILNEAIFETAKAKAIESGTQKATEIYTKTWGDAISDIRERFIKRFGESQGELLLDSLKESLSGGKELSKEVEDAIGKFSTTYYGSSATGGGSTTLNPVQQLVANVQLSKKTLDKEVKDLEGVFGKLQKSTDGAAEKTAKTGVDQIYDATKRVSDLNNELKDLNNKIIPDNQKDNPSFKFSKAIEDKLKELKDAENELNLLLYGKSTKEIGKENKAGESATEKAKKISQELLVIQSKLSNEQIRQQIESEQKLIDRQEDGFNKQFEQNKLNYKKELQQIKEFEDEKAKGRAEAILKFGKNKVPENLSESNVKNQVDTMKNDALLSFDKANSDTLKNLTDKYQSYADQRLEIEKKFNKDIEALQSQLPENKLADLKSKMLDLFGNGIGNVDLLARPMIDAAELVKKGWEDAGDGIATVFSSQFGISDSKGKEHEILVTPILPNGDVLSPDDLSNYVDNILSGSEDILKADNLGIVIGIDVKKDGSAGEVLHQLQEQMVNIKKDAPEVEEKIRKLIAKATADKGKGLLTFDFDLMKEAPEYIRAFEDLGTTSSETLNSLLGQFERFKEEAAKTLSPKELREYTATIQSIADELSNRDLYGSLIKQKDEAVKANQRLIKAENDLRLVKLGIGDPLLTEEEAIKRVNKAKDEYYNKNKKVLDTQKKIRDQVSALAKEMSGLGNALGGTSGEIISFIGDITSFYTTASEGIEKVAQTGAQAISVVEKASVILTIISTAIQLMKELNSILPDAFNQYEKYDEKIERINDMRDAVNEYEIAVLKANQAENSWFGNDSLRNLKDYKELQTKIFDSYRDKMLEEQAIYENKGSGGWLTNTFKSAVSWVSKITYGFDLLNKKYKEGTTAAVNNLRIETRKKSSGFLGSGIGGKSQKTEDLQTWINKNKDLFKGLDTQLFGSDGMLNQELAGVILEKYGDKLVGQTKETLEELKTLTEQYNEFRAQLREYVNSLYEPLVDNMVDSIWDWFDEGKDALDSFKDYAKQTFRDIVSDMIKTILLKDVFKDFQDNIAKLYEEYSKGNLTEAQLSEAVAKETNAVMDRYNTQLPAIQGMVDSINQNIKDATGIDLKNTDKSKGSSQTPSSGYSVSMSQDTGDKLVGIQTGSQMRLISLDQNVARIAQWNQPVSEKFNFDTIVMPLGALSQSSLRIERMMEEYRNISIQMFYLVRDIKSDTSNLSAIKDGIEAIKRNTDEI